jgi:hypothetical protein
MLHAANASLRHRKLQPSAGEVIPGQYIIELVPSMDPQVQAPGLVQALQQQQQEGTMSTQGLTEVMFYFDSVLNGFAVKNLPEGLLNTLLNSPLIKAVWMVRDLSHTDVCMFRW